MRTSTRAWLAAIALTAALTACGSEDTAAPSSSEPLGGASGETGDVDRYCGLVEELNAVGERVFADLPDNPSAEEVMAREQRFVKEAAPQLEELEEVAPEEIREDVPVFLDDLRARAETGESPDPEAAGAAEQRIRAFEEDNCPGGPDGS